MEETVLEESRPSHNAPTKRFSPLHISILIGSSAVSFGVIGFLAFLWAGSYCARNSLPFAQTWYTLLDQGWVLRAITLTTVLLRTATSLDAGIATSMLATLLLERQGVQLSRLAKVSILRSTDSPPHALAWAAWIDILTRPLHNSLRYLLTALLLTTLTTQFASTILLFDFTSTLIPRIRTTANSMIQFSYSGTNGPVEFTNGKQAPYFGYSARFPRFAEHSESPVEPPPNEERTFQDTGLTHRAFIPLPKEARQRLRQYSGPATVLETQVVCVRPTILQFAISSPQIPRYTQLLFANLTYSLITPAALQSTEMFNPNFTESVVKPRKISVPVVVHSDDVKQWPMSIVSVWLDELEGYLLLNWTADPTRDWYKGDLALQNSWQRRTSGEWTTMSHRTRNISIDVTMCVTLFNTSLYLIDTDVGEPAFEPEVTWDNPTRRLTTEDAAMYLSTRNNSSQLHLGMFGPPTISIPANYTGGGYGASLRNQVRLAMGEMLSKLSVFDRSGALLGDMWWAAILCFDTNFGAQIGLHNTFTGVFQEVIQRTHNPALAVQSLLTMATANAYIELQPFFDFELPVAYSMWETAFIPVRWSGFNIVAGAVVVQALAVVAVTVLFVRETRFTELGNSWHAVAQLMDDETRLLVPEAAHRQSGAFKKWIKSNGWNIRYRIVNEGNSPRLARVDEVERS
ncbi:hypothetical protein B0T14DRAFT_569373 [Immersiella caudata]|uniref:Uncharacterized protein n=1 Tax=Immersiella caudata TaxID=314043 RepID=A0AA39WDC4_9PEZI|nr:hypothetical protein B0T14DRAFT_569373 [Immersiella caudata]